MLLQNKMHLTSVRCLPFCLVDDDVYDDTLLTGDSFNPSPPGQNGPHFTYGILRCIFVNEKFYILIKISLKFVPEGATDNNPALV